jgi:hypothetical protein
MLCCNNTVVSDAQSRHARCCPQPPSSGGARQHLADDRVYTNRNAHCERKCCGKADTKVTCGVDCRWPSRYDGMPLAYCSSWPTFVLARTPMRSHSQWGLVMYWEQAIRRNSWGRRFAYAAARNRSLQSRRLVELDGCRCQLCPKHRRAQPCDKCLRCAHDSDHLVFKLGPYAYRLMAPESKKVQDCQCDKHCDDE